MDTGFDEEYHEEAQEKDTSTNNSKYQYCRDDFLQLFN